MLEFVAIEKRTLVGNIGLAVALTLSGVYQPWLAKYYGNWKTFNWIIFSQMGTVVLVPLFLPESCRWLIGKGEKEKCIKILKKIAKLNKKKVDDTVWTEVENLCDKQKKERFENKTTFRSSNQSRIFRNNYNYVDLFRTSKMRKISILITIQWMVISCIFDTTVRNISNLNFEFYLSFMIAASMEFPADMCSIWGINWMGKCS